MKKQLLLVILICIINHSFAQTGNVGIGTTSPAARLHVADSGVVFSGFYNAVYDPSPGLPPVSGQGSRLMWYPRKAAFRVGAVNGDQWDFTNIGLFSMALGHNALAKGESSVALGYEANALGGYAVALGAYTIATGDFTTASGYGTYAEGKFSSAFGESTFSRALGSVSFGTHNDYLDSPDPLISASTDRIFQIGNGSGWADRKNALTVLRNGNLGLGTLAPVTRLHVADSSVVFTGNMNPPSPEVTPAPISGAGNRLMWYPQRSAFRAGRVTGNQWDGENLGNFSFAAGINSKASGASSVALGDNTTASGQVSFASGLSTMASSNYATAMGISTNSSGVAAFAVGNSTTASGNSAAAFGLLTFAKSQTGFAIGAYNNLDDNPSGSTFSATDRIFQIGNGNSSTVRSNALTILRNGNIGIGSSLNPGFKLNFENTEGDKISLYGQSGAHYGFGIAPFTMLIHTDFANSDIAFGHGSSGSFSQTMRLKGTGQLHIDPTNVNDRTINSGAILFGTPGNTSEGIASRRTAGIYQYGIDFFTNGTSRMTVKNGGGVDVHGAICASAFNACSDIRYKTNFSSIHNALQSVLSLNGIYYDWKTTEFPDKHFSNARQLGFSAQEIEKLFPEIVYTNAEGYKSVDYGKLTPVLVEAVKEQQQEIETLKKELAEIKKLLLNK